MGEGYKFHLTLQMKMEMNEWSVVKENCVNCVADVLRKYFRLGDVADALLEYFPLSVCVCVCSLSHYVCVCEHMQLDALGEQQVGESSYRKIKMAASTRCRRWRRDAVALWLLIMATIHARIQAQASLPHTHTHAR